MLQMAASISEGPRVFLGTIFGSRRRLRQRPDEDLLGGAAPDIHKLEQAGGTG